MSERFTFSAKQADIIDRLIATGRFDGPQAVIGAALSLLEKREQERMEQLRALHRELAGEVTCSAFEPDAIFREIERLMHSGAVAGCSGRILHKPS